MFPEEQFGLSDEFCSNIEDYRNTTAYDRVESEVRRSVGGLVLVQLSVQMVTFNSIRSWTEHLVPILISFYIGSWSDHFG